MICQDSRVPGPSHTYEADPPVHCPAADTGTGPKLAIAPRSCSSSLSASGPTNANAPIAFRAVAARGPSATYALQKRPLKSADLYVHSSTRPNPTATYGAGVLNRVVKPGTDANIVWA